MFDEKLIVAMMTSKCPDENLKMELLKEKLTGTMSTTRPNNTNQPEKTVNKPQEITAVANKCYHCDRTGHSQASCWTHKTFCPNCGKAGHIVKKCWVIPSQTKGTKENQKSANAAEDYNCGPTPKFDL